MTKHIGIIEIKRIYQQDYSHMNFLEDRFFLLDINNISKKVYATYGPFDNQGQAKDHATFLGLEIKYND